MATEVCEDARENRKGRFFGIWLCSRLCGPNSGFALTCAEFEERYAIFDGTFEQDKPVRDLLRISAEQSRHGQFFYEVVVFLFTSNPLEGASEVGWVPQDFYTTRFRTALNSTCSVFRVIIRRSYTLCKIRVTFPQ